MATGALNSIKSKKEVKLTFTPHAGQEEIADALLKYRYLVIRAGRRFGKSALALNLVLREALNNPGRYWIVAPEYKQAKSIYWRDLVDEYIPAPLIVKKNDAELILEIRSLKGKNSVIEFKGSDNENTLRGAGLKGIILDEYAFQKDTIWDKVLGPMLVQTNGWAMFITTPNGVANHFKKFWDDAVAAESNQNSPDARKIYEAQMNATKSTISKEGFTSWQHLWKTFHFTSYDNPLIKPENLDAERARLTPEFFEQEYLAEFAKFTGLIYTTFNHDGPNSHVKEFEVDDSWTFFRSVDFGATDPNAVPFMGVDKEGVIHIFDEIYMNAIYTSELAEMIKTKSAHRYFTASYGDSAAKQSILDLGQHGIYLTPVRKNEAAKETGSRQWIIAGIDRVQQLLRDGKVVVHPRCKATIKEFMSYSWRKDRMGEAVNLPEDKNNHIMDAFRYFVMMYQASQVQETYNYLQRGAVDPLTGY